PSWTGTFSDEIVKIADKRKDVIGITAAMLHPVERLNVEASASEETGNTGQQTWTVFYQQGKNVL
ncbi:MAG: hypothetical protein RLZZ603_1061, partial [Actinomycetota bacterium]